MHSNEIMEVYDGDGAVTDNSTPPSVTRMNVACRCRSKNKNQQQEKQKNVDDDDDDVVAEKRKNGKTRKTEKRKNGKRKKGQKEKRKKGKKEKQQKKRNPRNQETKKPRNQETKKPRNQEANKASKCNETMQQDHKPESNLYNYCRRQSQAGNRKRRTKPKKRKSRRAESNHHDQNALPPAPLWPATMSITKLCLLSWGGFLSLDHRY